MKKNVKNNLKYKESSTIYSTIYRKIESSIEQGEYDSGEKLPPLRTLAAELGVSIDSVKKAYGALADKGLVVSRVGSGYYVKRQGEVSEAPNKEAGIGFVDLSFNQQIGSAAHSNALRRSIGEIQSIDALSTYKAVNSISMSHLAQIAGLLSKLGISTTAEELVLTSGVQHAINLVFETLLERNDKIAVSSLSYAGIKYAAKVNDIEIIPIEYDRGGIVVGSLVEAIETHPIKCIYLMPDFDNPTGIVLSEVRRRQIADLAIKNNILIIEDAALFNHSKYPTMLSLAPENTIYMFGFSKLLSAGLRVGVMKCKEEFREQLNDAITNKQWMVSPYLSAIIASVIESQQYFNIVQNQSTMLKERYRYACEKIKYSKYIDVEYPYHLWVELPKSISAKEVVIRLAHENVIVADAKAYSMGETVLSNGFRISMSGNASGESFIYGVDKIRQIILELDATPRWKTI